MAALLALAAAPDSGAEEERIRSLRISVPTPESPPGWGTELLMRALREVLGNEVVLLTGEETNADYTLKVEVARNGWLYRARALLIRTATGERQMEFEVGYYKPEAEAADRGVRIGRKTIEKLKKLLAMLPAPEPSPPPPPVPTSSIAEVRSSTAAPPPRDEGVDPFAAPTELSSDTGAIEEREGFEIGGWRWELRGAIGASYEALLHPDVPLGKDRNFAKLGARAVLTGFLGESARLRLVSLLEADVLEVALHRVVLEEGFVEFTLQPIELRLGWDSLTWGAASTFNIVDVINARDFREGFVDAPKIGEPMAAVRLIVGNHSFTAFYLTPFLGPRLPGLGSIFNPLRVDGAPRDATPPELFGGGADEWHPQVAARGELSFSGFDLRAFYFFGYERFPLLDLTGFRAFYPLVHQAGIDGQLIVGHTTIKWELSGVLHPKTDRSVDYGFALPGPRMLVALGAEQAIEDLWGTTLIPLLEVFGTSDSTWFRDDRPPDDLFQFFQNHAVGGFRWRFENGVGSELVMVDLIDLSRPQDQFLRAWYSERWFENFTFRLEVRWVLSRDADKLAFLRNLSGVYTTIQLNY